ncbi:MAG: NIPSNAP family protein [Pirellulaceae bacterium]
MMECFDERVRVEQGTKELSPPVVKCQFAKKGGRASEIGWGVIGRLLTGLAVILGGGKVMAQSASNQHYEWVHYQQVDKAQLAQFDQYLEKALLPALNRQGISPVGVFEEVPADAAQATTAIHLLLPLEQSQQVFQVVPKLAGDSQFLETAAAYLNADPKKPFYGRMRTEVLVAFDCMPKLKVPSQKAERRDRLFELRTYESSNEKMGMLKVEMFNNGEVPIFLDCGIQPVFFGQALLGDRLPNLTYMTVYDNSAARDAAWIKFREHPEWKKLSGVEKYQGTVSKIHKTDLIPRPYSQL